ncbi:MAG: flagellar protein [Lachnospiraceae bacterium]|nr:flagellar protein [Lachnospiraceae bacterium]
MKINNQFSSIEQVAGQYLNKKRTTVDTANQNISFTEVLKSKQTEADTELKFSKHAASRLADRQIDLTEEQMRRLENGTKKASEKGIQESLVLIDQLAFIVSVKNNTVITAMDQKEANDNIFTNIDGAVIM